VSEMKGVCPECEQISDLETLQKDLEIVVRGEPIEVNAELLRCLSCGEEFKDLKSDVDLLDLAFRDYRHKHNMLMPEEIRDLRNPYGLTQKELSDLLGWGSATLSRYENGALQSDANERMLRMLTEPSNLLRLIEDNPWAIPDEKRATLVKELSEQKEEDFSPDKIYIRWFGNKDADEFTGSRTLDLDRLFNLILFFCRGGVFKTKLNKLLFYADFAHFKKFNTSITGMRYVRLDYGPAPMDYGFYYDLLSKRGAIDIQEVVFTEDIAGEKLSALQEPDLSLFSDEELATMTYVKEHFKNTSSKGIGEISHREKGYEETSDKAIISYEFAKELQLD